MILLSYKKTNVLLFYERRKNWIKHNGKIRQANEKSRFLQNDAEINDLILTFKEAGFKVCEIENQKDLTNLIKKSKGVFRNTVAWNITDGYDIFLGTNFASFSKVFGIPVINCDAYTQTLSQFKDHHLAILKQNNILVPEYYTIRDSDDLTYKKLFEGPYFVKPARLDNSIGIRNESAIQTTWKNAIKKAQNILREYKTPAQIERFVEGKELTVPFAFLGNKWKFSVFEVKYPKLCQTIEVKEKRNKKILEAKPYREKAIKISKMAIKALGIKSYGRFDFRLDNKKNLVLIEFNSGASQRGLAWQRAISEWGYTFKEYLTELVNTTLRRAKNG